MERGEGVGQGRGVEVGECAVEKGVSLAVLESGRKIGERGRGVVDLPGLACVVYPLGMESVSPV